MSSSSAAFSLDHLSPPPSEHLCYVHCNFCDTVLAIFPALFLFDFAEFQVIDFFLLMISMQVSVPYTSLFKTVTVRCGHCTNLLSVNMRGLLLPAANQLHHLSHGCFNPPHQNLLDELQCQPPSLLLDPSMLCNTNNGNSCSNNGSSLISSNAAAGINNGNAMATAVKGVEDDQLPRAPVVNRQAAHCIATQELVFWSLVYQRKAICCNNCTAYLAFKLFPVAIVPSLLTLFSIISLRRRGREFHLRTIDSSSKDEIQRIKAGNPDITHREAFSAAAKNWAHFPHIHFGLMPDQGLKKANLRQLPMLVVRLCSSSMFATREKERDLQCPTCCLQSFAATKSLLDRWGWSGALNQSDVLSCAVAKHEEKDAWREWMGDVDDDMLM
ncbi:hypothetical protein ZIOFF_054103 [Zingiber officinale]|uniref:Uncharacterized protein n=1 Tax=Zingiber officinale TaxID=94328 RepID=A0A8J5FH17_ZINOF|nr:hypothetical protein ZIOFF_054103 [Zingiber officinale]